MARKRGRGMAACWYGIARTATVDRAAAWAEIDDGGTAKIVTGVTEIGEGILTVLAQIAEKAGDIDVSRAEAARKRAEERVARPHAEMDFERARIALMKSLIRLQVASRARTRA